MKIHEEKALARVTDKFASALSLGTSESGLISLARKGIVVSREVTVVYGNKEKKHATLVREFKKNES